MALVYIFSIDYCVNAYLIEITLFFGPFIDDSIRIFHVNTNNFANLFHKGQPFFLQGMLLDIYYFSCSRAKYIFFCCSYNLSISVDRQMRTFVGCHHKLNDNILSMIAWTKWMPSTRSRQTYKYTPERCDRIFVRFSYDWRVMCDSVGRWHEPLTRGTNIFKENCRIVSILMHVCEWTFGTCLVLTQRKREKQFYFFYFVAFFCFV